MPSADTLNEGANMARLFSLEHIAPPAKGVEPGDDKTLKDLAAMVWTPGTFQNPGQPGIITQRKGNDEGTPQPLF